jgi:4-amino-4-deoxy-L-arabinose transferase-like glycosyltransferase
MSVPARLLRPALPALVVAALTLIPFYNKAFTMADPYSLWMAEQILRDPLHPTAFDVVWNQRPERLTALLGPVAGYLLLPAVLLGGAEWVAHLVWLLLFAWGILATVRLALRLGMSSSSAAMAGLLLAASPAVLGMASTSFPDIPAMTFAVAAMERLCAWREERRWHQALTAAVFLTLAALSRPHVTLLFGVAALALAESGEVLQARTWRVVPASRWAPLFVAPVLVSAVIVATADRHGANDPGTLIERFLVWNPQNGIAWAGHYALSLPLTLPWLAMRPRRVPWWIAVLVAPLVAWRLLRLRQSRALYMALLVALTFAVLADIAADAWSRRDQVQMVLWAWLLLPLPTLAYLHLPPKYLVPAAPAIALLVARCLAELPLRRARLVGGATVATGLVLGILIIRADARQANFGRRAASELVAPLVQRGERVWFAGHWGFQWYAEKAGGRVVTTDPPRPQPGDSIVSATFARGGALVETIPRRHLVGGLREAGPGGRVMGEGAGFYSNAWGYLPWTWGTGEIEHFRVWQVY